MPRCPEGHESRSTDYCDTCGTPMGAQAPAQPAPNGATTTGAPNGATTTGAPNGATTTGAPAGATPRRPAGVECPHCQAINLPDSLFCEACGYDFTTGSMPRVAATGSWLDLESPLAAPDGPAPDEPAPAPEQSAPQPRPAPSLDLAPSPDPAAAPAPRVRQPEQPAPERPAAEPAAPGRPIAGPVRWVAELWIDPEWYEVQESPDPLPSPGLPDIVPLRTTSALIGRISQSRGVFPDIECGADTGVSRKQARLSTDGKRWFVEDLDSSNGTFVGPAAGPLPEDPLTPGRRHELDASDRIYVGAWTRIVLRHATAEESRADAGSTS